MRTVICFGEDWGRHPSTLQFIARQLAKDHTIIWIESLGLRRPKVTLADAQRIWTKLRKWWCGPARDSRVSDNLIVCTPLVLPFHGSKLAQFINRAILQKMIRRLVRDHSNGRAPVIVTASPSTAYLIDCLGGAKSVYYCADEYSQMPGVDSELVRRLEENLLQRVDAVVVTSEYLLQRKRVAGTPIVLLRHGVDCEHFSNVVFQEMPELPPSLRIIPRPIFGYHGLIQSIIDFELMVEVADRRPAWSLVFIGDHFGDTASLPSRPNLYYLPAQSYDMIPWFIKGFDVCMMPYRLDERTMHCNPIKLREYLAAGKPVLSTPLPEVLLYRDVVEFAGTADEFIRGGDKLLQETGLEYVKKRTDRVSGESWETVARRFQDVLDSACA